MLLDSLVIEDSYSMYGVTYVEIQLGPKKIIQRQDGDSN